MNNDSRERAKDVILKLVAAAGGELRGAVRLYKAFYFAHLFHWRDEHGVLTTHPIIRLQHGPAIDDGDGMLEELQDEGRLKITEEPLGPFTDYRPERVFQLVEDAAEVQDESDPEFRSCLKAIDFALTMNGQQLSDFTHRHSRSWNQVHYKGEMDVYTDLLNDEHYERAVAQVRQAEELLGPIFE